VRLRLAKYSLKRLVFLLPQLIGISIVTFFLLRLLPGNPAFVIAGPNANREIVAEIERELHLDEPIWDQYVSYLGRVVQGDFGTSWYTSQPVLTDLVERIPATLELISLALLVAIVVGIPLGALSAYRPKGPVSRTTDGYSLLAGGLPDFWLGLILIFFFYVQLKVFPSPIGRINPDVAPPTEITGFYLVDSAVTLNWRAFTSSFNHLLLPVITLAFVYAAPIVKFTRATMQESLDAGCIRYARAIGLPGRTIARDALRYSLPPIVAIGGITYGYLLGGAVLVESIFSWGGVGQYAVQAISNSDFAPIQAFVLFAAAFTLIVYLVVDLLQVAIDPRVRI
jgi:ABC-type dipeptide/oligopeptide/nickel transport system permease component